jgi:hypothetical protein
MKLLNRMIGNVRRNSTLHRRLEYMVARHRTHLPIYIVVVSGNDLGRIGKILELLGGRLRLRCLGKPNAGNAEPSANQGAWSTNRLSVRIDRPILCHF